MGSYICTSDPEGVSGSPDMNLVTRHCSPVRLHRWSRMEGPYVQSQEGLLSFPVQSQGHWEATRKPSITHGELGLYWGINPATNSSCSTSYKGVDTGSTPLYEVEQEEHYHSPIKCASGYWCAYVWQNDQKQTPWSGQKDQISSSGTFDQLTACDAIKYHNRLSRSSLMTWSGSGQKSQDTIYCLNENMHRSVCNHMKAIYSNKWHDKSPWILFFFLTVLPNPNP